MTSVEEIPFEKDRPSIPNGDEWLRRVSPATRHIESYLRDVDIEHLETSGINYIFTWRRAPAASWSLLSYGAQIVEVASAGYAVPTYAYGVANQFHELVARWRKETRILSSIQAKIFNRNYQRIVGMGPSVLPLIFSELAERGGQWYWALECITGDNPAVGMTTVPEVKKAWLDYALQRNFLLAHDER